MRQKALRLRSDGGVKVVRVDDKVVVMEVKGDHGTYQVELYRQDPWTFAISLWSCSCPWGDWAFKRQVTYVGRFCSHALAALYEVQSLENRKDSPLYRWNEQGGDRPYWAPDQPAKPARPKRPRKKRRSRVAARGTCYMDAGSVVLASLTGIPVALSTDPDLDAERLEHDLGVVKGAGGAITLVHGTLTKSAWGAMGHAWVEAGGNVFDFSNDRIQVDSVHDYYEMWGVEDTVRYTPEDALHQMVATENWGPWHQTSALHA